MDPIYLLLGSYAVGKRHNDWTSSRHHTSQLSTLYNNPEFSDMTIKCGDTIFHTQSTILTCYTPFFDTALSSGLSESTTRCVDLSSFNVHTVHRMPAYVYTSRYADKTVFKKPEGETPKDVDPVQVHSALYRLTHYLLMKRFMVDIRSRSQGFMSPYYDPLSCLELVGRVWELSGHVSKGDLDHEVASVIAESIQVEYFKKYHRARFEALIRTADGLAAELMLR